MTTQKLPGTDAARHGTGGADLTIMLAAHDAFRRDLTRLARAAGSANLSDPARRQSVAAGWELLKRQLHLHHTAEDQIIWPVLRPRLAHSAHAVSVLDAMEEEHSRIDPLLAAVDAAFAAGHAAFAGADVGPAIAPGTAARPGAGAVPEAGSVPGLPVNVAPDQVADIIDALANTLTGHLGHEERDGLPLIGVALTAGEWRAAGRAIARKNGLSAGPEMFAWMLDGVGRDQAAATLGSLPPPLRLLYRARWKPRFEKTPRW